MIIIRRKAYEFSKFIINKIFIRTFKYKFAAVGVILWKCNNNSLIFSVNHKIMFQCQTEQEKSNLA